MYSSEGVVHSYSTSKAGSETFTYQFPKGYHNDNGVVLYFDYGVVTKQGQTKDRYEVTTQIPLVDYKSTGKYKSINIVDTYKGQFAGPYNYHKFVATDKVETFREEYRDEFKFKFYNDYYSNNDPIKYPIKYEIEYVNKFYDNDLKFKKAYFMFEDEYDLYPKIVNTDEDSYKIIELEASIKKTSSKATITFTPKDYLYVNPNTLEMSSTPLDGYQNTKSLFLRLGSYELLKSINAKYVLEDVSGNHYRFYHNFTIETSRTLIGNCRIGEYCVQGEIADTIDTSIAAPTSFTDE